MTTRRSFLTGSAALLAAPALACRAAGPLMVSTPMAAPRWAMLQRQLLDSNLAACEAYYATYVDVDDALKVFVRWGANDGPDDAAEATNDWELLHALGGSERLLTLSRQFWEGHLRQFAAARTIEVPAARGGMYHREFPVQMDWQHNGEGLSTFNIMGLSTPRDPALRARTRRFADFYTGRDPAAPNYDPRHRVMRSMMNGSKGPMLRPATALDWAGDRFDPEPFHLEHGEGSYEETLEHYIEYDDVVCDSPLNLQATTLGLNAYALGSGDRFRRWALDYLDPWIDRARANGDILPSRVGTDGKTSPNWWGGVYGWGFSPVVPQTGLREDRNRVPRSITSFYNGLLLTGDMEYIRLWQRQNARLNALGRSVDGKFSTPTMHGRDGWYGWKPGPYRTNGFEIWYATQDPADLAAAGSHPWVDYLHGKNPDYPEQALLADLENVARRDALRKADKTTPETRLADWTLAINPASAKALVQLMTGGLHIARPSWSPGSPPQGGVPLHCRLRYFDADRRRAGVPEDVAALVHSLGDQATEVTLVNTGTAPRTVIVQGGSYAEHRIDSVTEAGQTRPVGGRHFAVRLEPGCGTRLSLAMSRYAYRPTLAFPWDRG